MKKKYRWNWLSLLILLLTLLGCSQRIGDYVAVSEISSDGFARDAEEIMALDGQEVKLWGYVDHGNMYGDEDVRAILGDFWGGDGPDGDTWRFNLKAKQDDEVGKSFAVYVPNDQMRDDILKVFMSDALEGKPTKVFVTGKLYTFEATMNLTTRVGIYLALESSEGIKFDIPGE